MGKSIIFITHRMQEILDICDKVSVLRDGELINTISTKNLNMGELSSYIIGDSKLAEIDSTDRKKTKKKISDETVLQLKDLSKMGDFMNINLEIKRGEIVGLAGLRGSGRTELFNSIIGINNFDTGVLKVKNVEKKFKSPSEALAGGIAYLPEERDREGIVNELGVMDNLVLSCLKKLCVFKNVGIIKDSKKRDLAKNLIKKLSIKTISLDQKVKDLSGGNKQKVVVGKILSVMPDIFILDEPTKGIDIEAKNSILNIIEKDLSREAGILITSPGLGDLIKICDRIIVLLNGEIVEEVESNKFNENKIYLAMQGKINS
jgi:ABC-type sugar transport system ATPase subunit